jgi:hypothetical protein
LTVAFRKETELHTLPETHANTRSTNAAKQQKRPGSAGDAIWMYIRERAARESRRGRAKSGPLFGDRRDVRHPVSGEWWLALFGAFDRWPIEI